MAYPTVYMTFSKNRNGALEGNRSPEVRSGETDLSEVFSSFVDASQFDLVGWSRKLSELSRSPSQPDYYQIKVNIHDVPEPARVAVMKALKAAVDSGVRQFAKSRVRVKAMVLANKEFRYHPDVVNAFASGIEWKDCETND